LYSGVFAALKKALYRDMRRSKWRSRRRPAGPGVRAAAGALVPCLPNTASLCSRSKFCCAFCRC